MTIVHYFLGFPPYRTGGLTRYAVDLMLAQVKDKQRVCALWPGRMTLFNKKVRILKNKKSYNALDEGIKDVDAFMKHCDEKIYENWISLLHPDVIHVHTLMGIHSEFFSSAHKLGVRVVYTTHDYYGLCPKVTFYRNHSVCDGSNCNACCMCNETALSLTKIIMLQSHFYVRIKNLKMIKYLRKIHRSKIFNESNVQIQSDKFFKDGKKYEILRLFYIKMLENIDLIHFNSTISEKIFRRFITPKDSVVLSISHSNVVDNRVKRLHKRDDTLRIAFLSPAKPYKGFDVLKKALDMICEKNLMKIELKVFAPVNNPSSYMVVKEDGFIHSQLQEIMDSVDVLIAPSVWYETFGFTVLEALSFGVPVIVSDRVGAKDIVKNGGIVVAASSTADLINAILSLTHQNLNQLEKNIKNDIHIISWLDFVKQNYQLYSNRRGEN